MSMISMPCLHLQQHGLWQPGEDPVAPHSGRASLVPPIWLAPSCGELSVLWVLTGFPWFFICRNA